MKVLFLDIDGVLNNFQSRNFGETFNVSACKNLNSLLKKVPELKIVVSSAWRMHGLAYMKKVLKGNGIDPDRIVDITGNEQGERGHQIQCWLDRNPGVTGMVIIDDESDMGALKDKLVKTSSYIGLTSTHVTEAIKMLEKPM